MLIWNFSELRVVHSICNPKESNSYSTYSRVGQKYKSLISKMRIFECESVSNEGNHSKSDRLTQEEGEGKS